MCKFAVNDIVTFEKRDEFVFSIPIALLRFSPDGKRFVVRTSNQYVYMLDMAQLATRTTAAVN
jgi:hypothetical protein